MSVQAPVIIVMLRQPRRDDARTDPFYEFGSFGLTGCHRRNLLADDCAAGCRLAFAQGGKNEVRLVMLTPPVDVRALLDRREALWTPVEMPLRYAAAPLLIDNDGESDVAGIWDLVSDVARETPVAKFSSRFRSSKRLLPAAVARTLIAAWDRAAGRPSIRAAAYWEALPRTPDRCDGDRKARYEHHLSRARGERVGPRSRC